MPSRLAVVRYMVALAVRNRLTVLLAVFAVLLTGVALTLTWITPGTERRTFFDLAYLGIEVLAVTTPILASIAIQVLEFDQRTSLLVLVRPVSRAGYAWGRFWGIVAAGWLNVLFASVLIAGLAFAMRGLPEPYFMWVVASALLETMVVSALACLAAFVTTSFVSALVVGSGIVLLGYLTPTLYSVAVRIGNPVLRAVTEAAYWLLPHLADYSVRDFTAPPEPWYLAILAAYSLAWSGAAIFLSFAVFSRRES